MFQRDWIMKSAELPTICRWSGIRYQHFPVLSAPDSNFGANNGGYYEGAGTMWGGPPGRPGCPSICPLENAHDPHSTFTASCGVTVVYCVRYKHLQSQALAGRTATYYPTPLFIAALSFPAASSCMDGRTWLYVSRVRLIVECPSRSWTILG